MTTINGTKKADILAGGNGDDVLKAGKGDDVLIGAAGADTMKGGKGADIFVVSYGDTILDFKSGVDRLVIDQPFERLTIIDDDLYTSFEPNPGDLSLIVTTPGIVLDGAYDIINA